MEQHSFLIDQIDYQDISQRYLPWVRQMLMRQGRNCNHAEDLMHDAWVIVLTKPKVVASQAKATTYFLGIVKLLWYKELRISGKFKKAFEVMKLDIDVNETTLVVEENLEKLDTLFPRLATPCQFILYSVYWLAKPLVGVQASLKHKSVQSTSNAKFRCLEALRTDYKASL